MKKYFLLPFLMLLLVPASYAASGDHGYPPICPSVDMLTSGGVKAMRIVNPGVNGGESETDYVKSFASDGKVWSFVLAVYDKSNFGSYESEDHPDKKLRDLAATEILAKITGVGSPFYEDWDGEDQWECNFSGQVGKVTVQEHTFSYDWFLMQATLPSWYS